MHTQTLHHVNPLNRLMSLAAPQKCGAAMICVFDGPIQKKWRAMQSVSGSFQRVQERLLERARVVSGVCGELDHASPYLLSSWPSRFEERCS